MPSPLLVLGCLVAVIWLAMLATRFWTTGDNDEDAPFVAEPPQWPRVVAVVPARDEVDVIERSLGSLAAQDYPGEFRVILVDDSSSDGTSAIARLIGSDRIEVRDGAPLVPGWTGKLWAVAQGIAAAGAPDYLWLTDADIEHAPDTLRKLVGIALAGDDRGRPRRLVSLMALLHCRTLPERPLIPAFVYFFKMLYPFGWINRTGPLTRHFAGAAGGCVLVQRNVLERAGGIDAIRGALIDDCSLGALIKRRGPIWLGLTHRSRSIRPYESAGEIGAMIARSAYAQLRYNPLLLVGTVLGLGLVFLAPPALAILASGLPRQLGVLAWWLMAISWLPVLGWYRRSPLWSVALPLVAMFYAGCTLWSGWAHYRGRGGMWKGRAQAQLSATAAAPPERSAGPSTASSIEALASGKGGGDENFPVASWLVRPDARAPIHAYYDFARLSDDIADHSMAASSEKLRLLGQMRAGLEGEGPRQATALAAVCRERGLDLVHARDLLDAFEQDCVQTRYPDWDSLIDYCRKSAMPVGRFVLDVHGEDRALWPMNDALCAALQIINHLQDCGKDYRALDRVYLPLDALGRHGVAVEALGEDRASPELRAVIAGLAARTMGLLDQSAPFAAGIRDFRLAAEVAVIQHLAVDLTRGLLARDPLSEPVHHGKARGAALALRALVGHGLSRITAMSNSAAHPAAPAPAPAPTARPALDATLRAKVAGSSFYAGMRVLPPAEREAMFAIYAFCRVVDDIADGDSGEYRDLDAAARAEALDRWRADIAALYAGRPAGKAEMLREAVARFGLEQADFEAVIDGMAMDIPGGGEGGGPIRWPKFATLDLYCDRVASAVGRLSVRVFGMEQEAGLALAHHLGRALQFTNILRDIDEDAAIGRVYLPAEALAAAGIATPLTCEALVADPGVDSAARWLAPHAEAHFREANAILARRPRGLLVAPRLMEAAYSRVLRRMIARGWQAPRRRVGVNKPLLLLSLLRHKVLG